MKTEFGRHIHFFTTLIFKAVLLLTIGGIEGITWYGAKIMLLNIILCNTAPSDKKEPKKRAVV